MTKIVNHLILLLTLISCQFVYSQNNAVALQADHVERYLGTHISILPGSYTFEEALNNSTEWQNSTDAIVSLGIPSNGVWLKLPVNNQVDDIGYILEIENAIIDTVRVYLKKNGEYSMIESGESKPFDDRIYDYQNFLYPLDVDYGYSEIYMYISSDEQLNLPISIGSESDKLNSITNRDMLFGLYSGIILVMFFYNFFIYTTTRDSSYLYYIMYILFVGMVQAALDGYGYRFLWSNSVLWQKYSLNFLNAGTALFSYLFFSKFIHLNHIMPKWKYPFMVLIGLYFIQIGLALAGQEALAYNIMNGTAMLLAILFVVASIVAIRKKQRQARYFLIAWLSFFTSIIIFVLKDIGVLPYSFFTSNVLKFGSSLEVVLLSFGLADRINILKQEKEESQKQALAASRENERIIREQNIILEEKVKERTKELNEALVNVQNAQTQLVEQEKMASLGQLTAGIAHEINNPINFVTANVKPLTRDIQDIFEVLDAYEEINSGEEYDAKKAEIEELKEELELDFIRKEIESLLQGVDDGAKRTAEIVRGLKIFSRMDEQDLKRVDLIEGIESTLTLLNSSMKGIIEINRDYDSVPKIECYAGKLNQVFMNILSNAVHAIKHKEGGDGKGSISISIKDKNEFVELVISDTGSGMPQKVIDHIFEPFYTTKPVGEGTGLGLSITVGIIEKHHGKISVTSEVGVGTSFIISLPKLQEDNLKQNG